MVLSYCNKNEANGDPRGDSVGVHSDVAEENIYNTAPQTDENEGSRDEDELVVQKPEGSLPVLHFTEQSCSLSVLRNKSLSYL